MRVLNSATPVRSRPALGGLAHALAAQPLRMGVALIQTQRLMRRAEQQSDASRISPWQLRAALAKHRFSDAVAQRFSTEAVLRKYARHEAPSSAATTASQNEVMPLVAAWSQHDIDLPIDGEDEEYGVDAEFATPDAVDDSILAQDVPVGATSAPIEKPIAPNEPLAPTASPQGGVVAALNARVQAARAARVAASQTNTPASVKRAPLLAASTPAPASATPEKVAEAMAHSPRPNARQVRRFSHVEEVSSGPRPSPIASPTTTTPPEGLSASAHANRANDVTAAQHSSSQPPKATPLEHASQAQDMPLAEFVQAVQRQALADAEKSVDTTDAAPTFADEQAAATSVQPTTRAPAVTDAETRPVSSSNERDPDPASASVQRSPVPAVAADAKRVGIATKTMLQMSRQASPAIQQRVGEDANAEVTDDDESEEQPTDQRQVRSQPMSNPAPVMRAMPEINRGATQSFAAPSTPIPPEQTAQQTYGVSDPPTVAAMPPPSVVEIPETAQTAAHSAADPAERREASPSPSATTLRPLSLVQRMMTSAQQQPTIAKSPRPTSPGISALQRKVNIPSSANSQSAPMQLMPEAAVLQAQAQVDGFANASPAAALPLVKPAGATQRAQQRPRPAHTPAHPFSPADAVASAAVVQRAASEANGMDEPVTLDAAAALSRTAAQAVSGAANNAQRIAARAPSASVDVQALAQQVYPILKRLLAVERERERGF